MMMMMTAAARFGPGSLRRTAGARGAAADEAAVALDVINWGSETSSIFKRLTFPPLFSLYFVFFFFFFFVSVFYKFIFIGGNISKDRGESRLAAARKDRELPIRNCKQLATESAVNWLAIKDKRISNLYAAGKRIIIIRRRRRRTRRRRRWRWKEGK